MKNKLSELLDQLKLAWSQIGLNQKITVVMAAAVVIIGVSATAFFTARTGYAPLATSLPAEQNSKVIAMLDESKIPYRITNNGSSIEVPSNQVHLMRMKMAEKGIAARNEKGYDIFLEPNIGASETILRINRIRALEEELQMTIREFDEVESANVKLTMPENKLLLTDKSEPTAGVQVKPVGLSISQSTVAAIRFLVSSAVEGMDLGSVAVTDTRGTVYRGADSSDSVAGQASSQLEARKEFEKYYAEEIQRTLDTLVGIRKSVVNVSVELNTDSRQMTEIKHNPDVQLVTSETVTEEITSSTTGDKGPGAGVAANINATTNSVAASALESSGSTNKVKDTKYAVDSTTSTVLQAAGGVKRISAAVMVDVRYVADTNGIVQIKPRTQPELENLKKHIQTALGIIQADDITVNEMEFNTKPAEEMMLKFEKTQDRQFYFELVRQGLYVGLPVLFIMLFVRMLKRTNADDIPLGVALRIDGEEENKEEEDELEPGVVTVDVLNRLLRENPDNMTQAIRSWLTEEPKNN